MAIATTTASGPTRSTAPANVQTELRSKCGWSSDWRRFCSTPSDASVLATPATTSARASHAHAGPGATPFAKHATTLATRSPTTTASTTSTAILTRTGSDQNGNRLPASDRPSGCRIPQNPFPNDRRTIAEAFAQDASWAFARTGDRLPQVYPVARVVRG